MGLASTMRAPVVHATCTRTLGDRVMLTAPLGSAAPLTSCPSSTKNMFDARSHPLSRHCTETALRAEHAMNSGMQMDEPSGQGATELHAH